MKSISHLLISTVLAGILVFLTTPPVPASVLFVYGCAIGVLIDMDHFLIARLKTGSWRPVWFCLRHPLTTVLQQDEIFEEGEVSAQERMFSHLLVSGVVCAALFTITPYLAVFSAVILYFHILADLISDRAKDVRYKLRGSIADELQ